MKIIPFAAWAALFAATGSQAQSAPSVAFSARATVTVPFEKIILDILYQSEFKNLEEGIHKTESEVEKFISIVTQLKISRESVFFSKSDVVPKNGFLTRNVRKSPVIANFRMELSDFRDLLKISGVVDEEKSFSIRELSFASSKIDSFKAIARSQALNQARETLKFYSENLGRPLEFSEIEDSTAVIGQVYKQGQAETPSGLIKVAAFLRITARSPLPPGEGIPKRKNQTPSAP